MRYLRSLSDLCGRLISIGGTGLLLLLLSAQAAETRKPSVLIPLRPLDSASGSRVSFQRDIRPILLDACVECHSTEEHKAGLDVSTVDGLKRGGKKDGPGVITPGAFCADTPVSSFLSTGSNVSTRSGKSHRCLY
jgi:hypothetical protein